MSHEPFIIIMTATTSWYREGFWESKMIILITATRELVMLLLPLRLRLLHGSGYSQSGIYIYRSGYSRLVGISRAYVTDFAIHMINSYLLF